MRTLVKVTLNGYNIYIYILYGSIWSHSEHKQFTSSVSQKQTFKQCVKQTLLPLNSTQPMPLPASSPKTPCKHRLKHLFCLGADRSRTGLRPSPTPVGSRSHLQRRAPYSDSLRRSPTPDRWDLYSLGACRETAAPLRPPFFHPNEWGN